MKEILKYLKSLRAHNDRIWFNEHKDQYLKVKDKIEVLTARLIAGVAEFDPDASRLRPADCLYRIYRDTRFSTDKTPYKTHIGIYINPPFGKKNERSGYYLHIEPGATMVAGGAWMPQGEMLKAIRQDIFDNVDEYLEILNNPEFKKHFGTIGEKLLKTAPKGFPKDWEYIDLLKPRYFTTYSHLTDEDIKSPDFTDIVLERMKLLKPMNDFFNYTIDQFNMEH